MGNSPNRPAYRRAGITSAMILAFCILLLSSAPAFTGESVGDAKKSLGKHTLILPAPVWIIGSYDAEGVANVMAASWVGICSSDPASVTVSLKESRYTYENVKERGAFTVNIPSSRFAAESAFFGTVSGRDYDKFAATGLTAVRSELVDAPYIKEFPLIVECRLTGTYEVGVHIMFIGEIVDVKADESVLNERGRPDISRLDPFVYATGSGTFHSIGKSLGTVSELQKKIER